MRSLLYALTVLSLPMRGAWIEITADGLDDVGMGGRSPCGERGLKFRPPRYYDDFLHVAPHAGSVD